MKFLILALCACGALARPDVSHILPKTSDERNAAILKQEQDIGPDGKYEFAYETANGIGAHEHGEVKNVGQEDEFQHKQGEVQWTSPEGQTIHLVYEADANGFHPVGDHLPTPPPIPEAIIRSLEYIRSHPPAPENPSRF